jgi:hypothetical protein
MFAQAGYRRPHPRIYDATLDLAGFTGEDAVFVGDSLRTDVLGSQVIGIQSVLLAPTAKRQVHREQVASLADAARLLLGVGTRPATTWSWLCTRRRHLSGPLWARLHDLWPGKARGLSLAPDTGKHGEGQSFEFC